jgi:uncharacterized repeat protein (TIGR01451 family)
MVEPLLAAGEPPISAMEAITVSIVNTATMTSDQTEELTSSVTNPLIGTVDPQITKQGDPAQAQIGDIVTFTIWVSNTGSINATGVTVRDDIANYLDILSVVTTKGTPTITGQTVVVDIGTLAPGELVSITIRTRVNSNAAPPPVNIVNDAHLTFSQGDPRDSERVVVRVPGGGGGGDDGDDDDGPPPPAPTPTPFATVPVIPTPTPEVVAVSMLPETGGRPSLLPSLPGLSLITVIAVLLLLALLKREGKHSDEKED